MTIRVRIALYGADFKVSRFWMGIPVDRDRSFRFVVTGDSGSS